MPLETWAYRSSAEGEPSTGDGAMGVWLEIENR